MAQSAKTILLPKLFGTLGINSQMHLGGFKATSSMAKYIFGKREDKVNVFDLEKTWEKMVLAARACAGIKHAESIVAISGKTFGRKPVLKFAEAISCKAYTGRFIPGSFTNTNIRGGVEPRLIIVSDPVADAQAIREASSSNCPVIAFCNTDADLSFVDIAIPVNNRSRDAIGACFFMLARLINYIKTGASLEDNIKEVELYLYRDPVELESLMAEQNAGNALVFQAEMAQVEDNIDFGQTANEVDLTDSANWD